MARPRAWSAPGAASMTMTLASASPTRAIDAARTGCNSDTGGCPHHRIGRAGLEDYQSAARGHASWRATAVSRAAADYADYADSNRPGREDRRWPVRRPPERGCAAHAGPGGSSGRLRSGSVIRGIRVIRGSPFMGAIQIGAASRAARPSDTGPATRRPPRAPRRRGAASTGRAAARARAAPRRPVRSRRSRRPDAASVMRPTAPVGMPASRRIRSANGTW